MYRLYFLPDASGHAAVQHQLTDDEPFPWESVREFVHPGRTDGGLIQLVNVLALWPDVDGPAGVTIGTETLTENFGAWPPGTEYTKVVSNTRAVSREMVLLCDEEAQLTERPVNPLASLLYGSGSTLYRDTRAAMECVIRGPAVLLDRKIDGLKDEGPGPSIVGDPLSLIATDVRAYLDLTEREEGMDTGEALELLQRIGTLAGMDPDEVPSG